MGKNTTGNLGMLQIPATNVRSQQQSKGLQPGTPEYDEAIARQQAKQAEADLWLAEYIEQQQQPVQQAPASPGAEDSLRFSNVVPAGPQLGAPDMTQEQLEAWQAQQQARADKELSELLKQIHGGNAGERQLTPVESPVENQLGSATYGGGTPQMTPVEGAPNATGSTAGRNTARSVQLMGGEDDGLFGTGISGGDLLGSAIGAGINYAVGKATEKDAGDVGKAQGEAFEESYPKIVKSVTGQLKPIAKAEYDVKREFAPKDQRLQYEQFVGSEEAKSLPEGYVPGIREYAILDSDVDHIRRRGGAATDLDIMRLQGPYMAESSMDQLYLTDRPFLETRDTGAQKVRELLGSINMGGLSGGERAEIERMNARRNLQRGQAGGGGNLTAIENAMQFGSRLDQKRSQLGQALQSATNFMAGSRTGYDPIQATLGRSSGSGAVTGNFQGVQPVQNYMAAGQTAPSNLIQGSLEQDNSFLGRVSRGGETLKNFWQGGD